MSGRSSLPPSLLNADRDAATRHDLVKVLAAIGRFMIRFIGGG